MDLEQLVRFTNRNMIIFDLALGTGAILAPDQTLKAIGHDTPSDDARVLFRRCGPIWLTFAAAHAVAAFRDEPRDWWAVAWLRGTEIATDVVWSTSPKVNRPLAKEGLRFAGLFNLALAAGSAMVSRREAARQRLSAA
jgi:hypothetical protein